MKYVFKFLICLGLINFIILFGWKGYAQSSLIDSLNQVVSSTNQDTNTVNALIELSGQYRSSSPDSAIIFGNQAKSLAEKLNFQKGVGYSLKAIGLVYNIQGNYVEALRVWKQALQVFEENKIEVGAANMLNNIGVIYYNKSDETNALDYYLKSLKVSEDIKDTFRIATALMNLGGVYSNKPSTYEKALSYHQQAYSLSKAINNQELIGGSSANIGELFMSMKKLDSSLIYLMQAKSIYEGSSDLPYTLNIIGKVYRAKHDYSKAILFHSQAYDSAKVYDAKLDMGQALLGIAETYKEQGQYQLAISNYQKAQLLFEEIGLDESYDLVNVYEGLATCYTNQSNFQKASEYKSKLLDLKAKIYNIEVDKSLGTKLFAYEIDKKQSEINLQQEVISRQNLLRNGLIGGFLIMLIFAGIFFRQRNRISKEKKRSDDLLLNILPAETAEELKRTGTAKAKDFAAVTVLFTDFKNFSKLTEQLNAQELVNEINLCYCAFDNIIHKYGIEKIKTIGDSYMCASGLPVEKESHAIDMAHAAIDIRDFIEQEKQKRITEGKPYFEIRIGLNSGPLVAGIVGLKKFAYDIWGDVVNIASRMESSSETGKVNISGSTYELIKDHFECTYRGKIEAKGKGAIDMYFVENRKSV